MKYHNVTKCDMKNGEGLRVVLWVSHCEHKCRGCHNPQTWDKESGIDFDNWAKEEIFNELDKDYIQGLTLSGGDPLSTLNREEIKRLIKEIKHKYKNKDIWCYTGYLWEDVETLDVLKYIDVLIDGKYVSELNTPSSKWRGSSNQRIINVQESLKQNKIILLDI